MRRPSRSHSNDAAPGMNPTETSRGARRRDERPAYPAGSAWRLQPLADRPSTPASARSRAVAAGRLPAGARASGVHAERGCMRQEESSVPAAASHAMTVPAMRTPPPRWTKARAPVFPPQPFQRTRLYVAAAEHFQGSAEPCSSHPDERRQPGFRQDRRPRPLKRRRSLRRRADRRTGTIFRFYDFEYQLALQFNGQPLAASRPGPPRLTASI